MNIGTTLTSSSPASQAPKPSPSTPPAPEAQPSIAQEDTVALQGQPTSDPNGLMDVVSRSASAVTGATVGGLGTLVSTLHYGPAILPVVARSSYEIQRLSGHSVAYSALAGFIDSVFVAPMQLVGITFAVAGTEFLDAFTHKPAPTPASAFEKATSDCAEMDDYLKSKTQMPWPLGGSEQANLSDGRVG